MFSALTTILFVAGLVFVAAAAVVSYAKFDHLAHLALREPARFAPRDALLWRIASRMAETRRAFCVGLIEAGGRASGDVVALLRPRIRASDQLLAMAEGRVGLIMTLAPENVGKVMARLQGLLPGDAVRAAVVMVEQQASAEAVLTALEQELQVAGSPGHPAWSIPTFAPAPQGDAGDAALRDPLTGLLAPNHVPGLLRRHLNRMSYRKRPMLLVQFGIDRYGEIVERRGRAAADSVLAAAGRVLDEGLRERDFLARSTDEGFLAVFESRPEGAAVFIERILRTAASLPPSVSRPDFTLSAGIAVVDASKPSPARSLLQAHDALLDARRSGGNTWRRYEEGMSAHRVQILESRRHPGHHETNF